jgi:hypothetical protein
MARYRHLISFLENVAFNNFQNLQGRNPPTDQTIKIRTLYKIPKSIFIGMCILASTGILLAFGFLIFNIKFRQHRLTLIFVFIFYNFYVFSTKKF